METTKTTHPGQQTLSRASHLPLTLMHPGDNDRPVPVGRATTRQVNLLTLLKALRKKCGRAIILGLIVGLLAAGALWFIVPADEHIVTATILLEPNPPGILEAPRTQVNPEEFRELQKFRIKHDHRVLSDALDHKEVRELAFVKNSVDPIRNLKEDLEVSFRGAQSMLVSLRGDDPDSQKKILTALIDSYVYDFHKREEAKHRSLLASLKESEKRLAQEVAVKEAQKVNLEKAAEVLDFGQLKLNQAVAKMILDLANRELARIRLEKIKVKQELDAKLRNPQAVVPAKAKEALFNADKLFKSFKDKLEEVKNEMDAIARAFVKEKAELLNQALKKKADEFKERIENRKKELIAEAPQLFVNILDFLKQKWAALCEFEVRLLKEVKELQKANQRLLKIGRELRKVEEELQNSKSWLGKIRDKLERLQIERNASPHIEVPESPIDYQPPPLIGRRETTAGVGAIGSFLFILLAFAWFEFRARRIDSRDEIMQALGMTPIGALPDLSYRPRLGLLQSRSDGDAAHHRILMDSVDAARNMILSVAADEKLQVLLVTSAMVGEGKTSSAGHLAASLGRAGKKTLLVDCDLRNPNVHRLFNAVRSPGLSEILRGECQVADAIQELSAKNLSMIAAVQFSLETLEHFSQDRISEIIDQLREDYDFIVLDSSPVLLVPESHTLANSADAVIMSVLRNVSQLPNLQHATEMLTRLGARMLGFVMNGVRDRAVYCSRRYTMHDAQTE